MKALVLLLASALALSVAPARAGEPRVEDQSKGIALVPPEGFVVSVDSSAETLVLIGPRLSGVDARLEVHGRVDGRPPALALTDFERETLQLDGEETRDDWSLPRDDDALANAVLMDRTSQRKSLRTGVAATRHGPYLVLLVAEAAPAMFEQLQGDYEESFRALERLPLEADWRDEALEVALHSLPEWLELQPDKTEAGKNALWRWESLDKTLWATLSIEAREPEKDPAEHYDDEEQKLRQSSGLSDLERRDQFVSGEKGARFEATLRGGSTRWEVRVQQGSGDEARMIVVTGICPTSLVESDFGAVFQDVFAHLTIDGS